MFCRSFARPEQAIEAWQGAYRLNPDICATPSATRKRDFLPKGGVMDDKTRQVVEHILAKSPKHQGAQMLMAMGEMRAGNYAQSRKWVELLRTEIQARPWRSYPSLKQLI